MIDIESTIWDFWLVHVCWGISYSLFWIGAPFCIVSGEVPSFWAGFFLYPLAQSFVLSFINFSKEGWFLIKKMLLSFVFASLLLNHLENYFFSTPCAPSPLNFKNWRVTSSLFVNVFHRSLLYFIKRSVVMRYIIINNLSRLGCCLFSSVQTVPTE